MMKFLLRRLIRTLLEAAQTSSAAAAQGYALLKVRNSGNSGIEYILYNPSSIAIALEDKELSGGSPIDEYIDGLDPSQVIIGYLDVRPHRGDCWDAGEIKFAAAQKGYGPTMYELAMSDFGRLMSDHGTGTSPSARVVWQKYAERPDIKQLKFDDVKEPKTPPKEDDCKLLANPNGDIDYLNAAYAGAGESGGKDNLVKNHIDFMKQIENNGFKRSKVEFSIRMKADEYFSDRYAENK
jgi:hypothetical protein